MEITAKYITIKNTVEKVLTLNKEYLAKDVRKAIIIFSAEVEHRNMKRIIKKSYPGCQITGEGYADIENKKCYKISKQGISVSKQGTSLLKQLYSRVK